MARPFAVPRELQLSLHAWPTLTESGQALAGGMRYGLALLACLVVCRRPVPRLHMATLLWPEANASTARTRLRRLVYAFNECCGTDLVGGDADTLFLNGQAATLQCDVLQVQELAQAIVAPATTALPPAALLLHADAHCFMHGFSIDSCGFDDWIGEQRREHERLVHHALQRLAERSVASGDVGTAILAAERLVALDPFAERGYASLMVALGQRGDAAAIEAAYFRCAELLRDEFGVPPSPVVETAYASATAMARRSGPSPAAKDAAPLQVRYTHGDDGVRLAYAVSGEGRPLIKAATWLSQLDYDRDSPVWSHLVRELSRQFAFVRYDERGCGLSEREVGDLSFERWVDDLQAVATAMGVARFALLGISQGASIAAAYAVRHPEQVTHLVLHGAYARGRLVRSDTPEQREEAETMAKLAELGWGKAEPSFRQFFTSQFIPDGTLEQHEWFNELERISTSPRNAARFMREFATIDVVRLLPQVRCPTLVLHSLDDVRVPVEEGRFMAAAIPGARFVPVHSRNHLLLEQEAAWPHWLEEVRAFLNG